MTKQNIVTGGDRTQKFEAVQQSDGTWTMSGLTLEQVELAQFAPAMLAALKQVENHIGTLQAFGVNLGLADEGDEAEMMDQVRNAIADAEGE